MNMQEIREIAQTHGLKAGKLSKVELVRTIQREEGNYDCFATPTVETCGQDGCLWRGDCLKLSAKGASA